MSEVELQAEDFLELVWGERKGWVDLPAKVGKYWVPYHVMWDDNGATNAVSRRIDSCLREGEDLYFSVGQFRKKGRNAEDFMPTSWLWADLDEVHPAEAGKISLTPTLAWASSGGRYQALWRLDRSVGAGTLERLNRALSYKLGADRGGWDLTQVLRVVGTRNFKYPDAPLINVLWYDEDLTYNPKRVWSIVRGSAPPESTGGVSLPRKAMPARARALLRVPPDSVVEGERSHRLWELECLLAEAGWGEDEIYAEVEACAWNKWARVRTGEERLRREIRKAIRHVLTRTRADGHTDQVQSNGAAGPHISDGAVREDHDHSVEADESEGEDGTPASAASPFVRYANFMAMSMEAPRWMIEGLWTEGAHGIIGGEPKTSKTTLALAMALSVASGKDFLGTFPVHSPGPVLVVQEENAPWNIQDRLRKVASSYGLISKEEISFSPTEEGSIASTSVALDFPADIPLRLLNNYGLDLSFEEHRDLIENEVAQVRPALVIMDPLYLIFGGGADVDKMKDLRPFLAWLLQLRFEYNCAIAVIHHFRKQQAGVKTRPGQRIMGSATLHGWVASSIYCSALDGDEDKPGWKRVMVEREFREQAPQKALEVGLNLGEAGNLDFDSYCFGFNAMRSRIMAMVLEEPGVTEVALAEALETDRRTVRKHAGGIGIRVAGLRGGGRSQKVCYYPPGYGQ